MNAIRLAALLAAAAAFAEGANDVTVRGEKISGQSTVALATLLSTPQEKDGKTVTTEGTVRKNCERRGCWMELTPANASKDSAGLRVTFKDYGFFVPLDSAGKTARVEGVVKVAELDEAYARHLESEGAHVNRGKDGKAREVQLVARGVELRAK